MLQEAIKRGAFLMPPSRGPERPNIAALLTTAAEIAAGMAFLHARGIIHGDLSGCARPLLLFADPAQLLVASYGGYPS